MNSSASRLPGEDIVRQGVDDLAAGRDSIPALLVEIAQPRLRRLGLPVHEATTPGAPSAEIRPYQRLRREVPRDAYSRYNALLRLISSYARALEHAQQVQRRGSAR